MASEVSKRLSFDQLVAEMIHSLAVAEIATPYGLTVEQVLRRLSDEFGGKFSRLDDYAEGFYGHVWIVDRVIPLSQVAAWREDGEAMSVIAEFCGVDQDSLQTTYDRWKASGGR